MKNYGDVEAVRGVDLEILDGECFALLGPNGAGKTTTTEILEGYRHRTAGDVKVLGVDPQTSPREWRARLGIVLQTSRDLGDLTVHESLEHFAGEVISLKHPALQVFEKKPKPEAAPVSEPPAPAAKAPEAPAPESPPTPPYPKLTLKARDTSKAD